MPCVRKIPINGDEKQPTKALDWLYAISCVPLPSHPLSLPLFPCPDLSAGSPHSLRGDYHGGTIVAMVAMLIFQAVAGRVLRAVAALLVSVADT